MAPIGKHEFFSENFRDFQLARTSSPSSFHEIVSKMPSPFPRLFLEGIDQQLADMSFPRGAYLLGSRIEGQLPWFCLVAFWIKEQPAIPTALCIGFAASLARWRNNRSKNLHNPGVTMGSDQKVGEDDCIILISILMLLAMLVLFTSQANLVWNMRYLIPAVPLLYVVAANCIPRPRIDRWNRDQFTLIGSMAAPPLIAVLLILDMTTKWSHPFSYTNPLFGGDYRVPMALNDSNFDYGQDLRFVESWIRRRTNATSATTPVFRIVSGLDRNLLESVSQVADQTRIEQAIWNAKHRGKRLQTGEVGIPLILSRSLFHAEPWANRESDISQIAHRTDAFELIKELLSYEPAEWITPTTVVYDCGKD